jgi:uncharacterized protein (UPF0332 family)
VNRLDENIPMHLSLQKAKDYLLSAEYLLDANAPREAARQIGLATAFAHRALLVGWGARPKSEIRFIRFFDRIWVRIERSFEQLPSLDSRQLNEHVTHLISNFKTFLNRIDSFCNSVGENAEGPQQ